MLTFHECFLNIHFEFRGGYVICVIIILLRSLQRSFLLSVGSWLFRGLPIGLSEWSVSQCQEQGLTDKEGLQVSLLLGRSDLLGLIPRVKLPSHTFPISLPLQAASVFLELILLIICTSQG